MLPVKGEPRRIGRRLLTFLVTVPLAMLTSLLAALAARSLAGLGGWAEADGNGLTLLLLPLRSEEHTSELQSLMRISYAVFCLKKKKTITINKVRQEREIPT